MRSGIFVLLGLVAAAVPAASQRTVRIVPSRVDEVLQKRKANDPNISLKSLAAIGNKLAAKSGFDFAFAPEGFRERKDDAIYAVTRTTGGKLSLSATKPDEHPCGISTSFPVAGSTRRSLTLLVKAMPIQIVLDKNFIVDTITLVDSRLKKQIRSWVVPMDRMPEAISIDGTKIYVNSSIDDLFIEIDRNGGYKYAAKEPRLMLTRFTDLQNFPKEKDNDYLGFRRFTDGKTSYTVKFSHPCT